MYEIIVGRDDEDRRAFGDKGTFLIGKHYVKMGQVTSLSTGIYMDVLRSHVVSVFGKRGSGKCVTGDTLIALSDGRLIPIKDLENDASSVVSLDDELKIVKARKTAFYKRYANKLLKITLRSGKEIKLTPEHPLLTIYGWAKAAALSSGSRIATPRHLANFGNELMSENEIKLLAYLIAEGHLKQGILFANSNQAIIDEFKTALKEFDSNAQLVKLKKDHYRVYTRNFKPTFLVFKPKFGSTGFIKGCRYSHTKTKIRLLLERHGLFGKLSREKYVPELITKLPKNLLALFLNRLFTCDGSIYKSRKGNTKMWEISYSSVSELLIRQIQHFLLRFDVVAKLRHKKTKINGKTINSFELVFNGENLLNFVEQIGFFGEKARKQLVAQQETVVIKRNPNVDTIPRGIWNLYRPDNWARIGRAFGYKYPKSLCESVHYSPSRPKLLQIALADKNELLLKLATSDIFWDEILSVDELNGSFEVYDLSVPELHNFVANDIIVHNSYTLAAVAEGMLTLEPELTRNLSIVIFDTMGIFWTMKYENKKDESLLKEWGIPYQRFNIRIYAPEGSYSDYKDRGIPVDLPFSVSPSELTAGDWCSIFEIDTTSQFGTLIGRVVSTLRKQQQHFSISDIIAAVKGDGRTSEEVRAAVENMFSSADDWGLFSEKSTPVGDLAVGGQITVLDISPYAVAGGKSNIRALVIGLVSKKLFNERMVVRKSEEMSSIKQATAFSRKPADGKKEIPLIWLMVDEAHEFLPKEGATPASNALITILREGRQPGISLVLASQQPGQIHTDVMTQSDIVISHRVTAKIDVDALGALMQTYMREGLDKSLNDLPRVKGAALLFDDTNERLYPMRVRPRATWHGGSSPSLVAEAKGILEF